MQVAGDLTRVIALILLPVGILMCGYALAMFLLRGRDITNHTQKLIEDRRCVCMEGGVHGLSPPAVLEVVPDWM